MLKHLYLTCCNPLLYPMQNTKTEEELDVRRRILQMGSGVMEWIHLAEDSDQCEHGNER
jgi:hypothetical protein